MKVKDAMMLCVDCKEWSMPKHILVETVERDEELLSDIASKVFNQYKKNQNEDVYLVDYTYYGNVEVIK